MKITWSPISKQRLNDIADYISLDKPEAARKWLIKVFQEVEKLALFPKSGRKVPEINREDIREIIFGNYRIIYKIESEEIIIVSVRHGKQLLYKDELK